MIVFGGVSLDEAFHAIDWDTIALPLGMMIVVAHLKVSGAFRGLGGRACARADGAADRDDPARRPVVGVPGQ